MFPFTPSVPPHGLLGGVNPSTTVGLREHAAARRHSNHWDFLREREESATLLSRTSHFFQPLSKNALRSSRLNGALPAYVASLVPTFFLFSSVRP